MVAGRKSVVALVTDEEKEIVKRNAKELGMTVSDYMRSRIINSDVPQRARYDEGEAFLTLQEFAKLISVSRSKAREICIQNKITFHMIDGRHYRIRKADADRYLKNTRIARKIKDETLEPLLTVQEVAARYRVTPQTVDTWIKKGKMKAHRIDGKHMRIKLRDADSMLSVYKLDNKG